MQSKDITGEYYLSGQMEMASGFLLRPGGDFQFFFSYGALDRQGSGKWELKDGQVRMESAPKPAYDFALVKSSKIAGDMITIKMEAANPVLLHAVFCSLQRGIQGSWLQMSQYGKVEFPQQKVETVSLLLEFCSERFSTIPVTYPDHNEFIFHFEPTIMEVFLENFRLQVEAGGLSGGHPLMGGESFRYVKQ